MLIPTSVDIGYAMKIFPSNLKGMHLFRGDKKSSQVT